MESMTKPTSEPGRLLLELNTSRANISLRNPPVNVIDIRMMEELGSALAEIESHAEIGMILLRGEGKCFSSGVDVAAHAPGKVGEMLEKFHAVIRALVATKKITIAAVHGHCLGGGAELAMVCDIVITADSAVWGFPEIKLGCFPPVAATALGALIGQKRASELILTGRTITGREAAQMGLATNAAAEQQLQAEVDATVGRLQSLSPAALACAKKAIYAWDAMHFDKGLARAEKVYHEELTKTADAEEGIRAFLERRNPQWKGR